MLRKRVLTAIVALTVLAVVMFVVPAVVAPVFAVTREALWPLTLAIVFGVPAVPILLLVTRSDSPRRRAKKRGLKKAKEVCDRCGGSGWLSFVGIPCQKCNRLGARF